MIKVQPAYSRLVKTETPEQLTITCPPKGFFSIGGCLTVFGSLMLLFAAQFIGIAFAAEDAGPRIALLVGMIPGIVFVVGGVTIFRKSWSISRSADWVTFARGGLWGRKQRRWHAQEVSAFWVSEQFMSEGPNRQTLIIGFSNGRSERLVEDHGMKEDFNWIAAMMRDRKGAAKAPSVLRIAAEPVIRRVDPAVNPSAVAMRRLPDGVELVFLPLIQFKARWWKLLGLTLMGLALILGASWALGAYLRGSPLAWTTRSALALGLLAVIRRFRKIDRATVIQVADGFVTIVQNQNRGNHQFAVGDVEFVQSFRTGEATELQFLLKGKSKVRLLQDRPADEVEWAARFLRVAIKGRPPEEAAVMKMETAEGECQVCGEKMESRVVFCAKCRTPHHEECWSYVGQCSTFACREIRFTRT